MGRVVVACFACLISLSARAQVSGDFNNDGFDDLAIGVPGEHIGAVGAGAVSVIYGRADGLSPWAAVPDQFWHENRPGMPDTAEKGDALGRALAAGDFNGDGFDDLAIGIPGERLGPDHNAGAVIVLFGSDLGLAAISVAEYWHQDVLVATPGGAESEDRFGEALASGDFDGDAFDDLAIGVPGETFGAEHPHAGAVALLYGSADGLNDRSYRLIRQATAGIVDGHEAGDHFGQTLAAGDFNGDGLDDLAIGAPDEDFNGSADAGVVHVLHGAALGLNPRNSRFWHQDLPDIANAAAQGDRFGASVVAGDFNGDGADDLVIGVPGEDIGALSDAGAAQVLYGSAQGLLAIGSQFISQDTAGADAAETGDRFGHSFASGDFEGDGFDDLAIGIPYEAIGGKHESGAVTVLRGSAAGLTAEGSQFWHLTPGKTRDHLGAALASGDFDNDGRGDLAMGVPGRDVNGRRDAGMVWALYGSASGLDLLRNRLFQQSGPGMQDHADEGDQFGAGNAP